MELGLDLTNLQAESVGEKGVPAEMREKLTPVAVDALRTLLENPQGWPLGWLDLPARRNELPAVLETLSKVADADMLVTIGMGGSGLGTRALASLFAQCTAPGQFVSESGKRLVVLDNLDEENTARVASDLADGSVVLNPVSKSGTTLETIANFTTLLHRLGERAQVVVTTGDVDVALGRLAANRGYPLLQVPDDVGGRFSVLTCVGFFPLAFLGVDVEAILQGALNVRQAVTQPVYYENAALLLALDIYALATRCGISQMFFLPYGERMCDLGRWWVQLFAESLGKKYSLSGEVSPKGITPVVALGPSDQHSVLQLLLEGPADKVIALVEIEEPPVSAGTFTELPEELAGFNYLRGKRIHDIVRAELSGTRGSLTNQGRPNYTVTFPRLTPSAVGEFLFLYEVVVGLLGVMFDINAFDEPAVVESKRLTREMLGKSN